MVKTKILMREISVVIIIIVVVVVVIIIIVIIILNYRKFGSFGPVE